MRIPETVPWCSKGVTLGSGGQGVVQLVTRKNDPDGPKYALKALRNTGSTQAQSRFRREIEVIKEMTHPAIIRVIDHSQEDDEFQYYVMEYHEDAQTLANVIFSSSINRFHGNVLLSLDLFEQIISAISACEKSAHRIVHRDINPKNILVLRDGSIRLIDFGICQIEDGMIITLADEGVGARNYTSPECESGDDSAIDVRSDIYSAAKVLWSAITSQRAFAREEPAFKGRSMKDVFPTKTETWHLTLIFEKTIRRRPDVRFSSTDEVLDLLHEVRYVIQNGYPPLEDIKSRCPSCGWKSIGEFPDASQVFGPPHRRNFAAFQCRLCGFGFTRDTNLLQDRLEKWKGLS